MGDPRRRATAGPRRGRRARTPARAFAALRAAAQRGDARPPPRARGEVDRALDGFTAAPVHRRGAGAPRPAAAALRRARARSSTAAASRTTASPGTSRSRRRSRSRTAAERRLRRPRATSSPSATRRRPTRSSRRSTGCSRLVGAARQRKAGVARHDDVEAARRAHRATSSTASCRRRGQEADDDSDFDLIALTLDRMEAAVGAGQYRQAEQARLEAYAFFEFGPELRLRVDRPRARDRGRGPDLVRRQGQGRASPS